MIFTEKRDKAHFIGQLPNVITFEDKNKCNQSDTDNATEIFRFYFTTLSAGDNKNKKILKAFFLNYNTKIK
jgi:hypothetical protein